MSHERILRNLDELLQATEWLVEGRPGYREALQSYFAQDAPTRITFGQLFALFDHALNGEHECIAEVHQSLFLGVSMVYNSGKRGSSRNESSGLIFFDYDRVTPLVVHHKGRGSQGRGALGRGC